MLVGLFVFPRLFHPDPRHILRLEPPHQVEAVPILLHRIVGLQGVLVERHPGAETRTAGRLLSMPEPFAPSLLYWSVNQLTGTFKSDSNSDR